ncbi:hypothetical protein B0H34DRAFT_166975 [Crassisporium funariophilum]|nr:hypothetical protein B0H34DRAFT_166975 [Crassisporium funariophilum]
MFFKSDFAFLTFVVLATMSEQVLGREAWLERDGRAVYLYPRRFGQEQPAVLQKIRNACPGAVCGNLAGQAVTPLLAAQPECSQQDMADAIIDASKQFDAATAAAMVAAAIEYRQVEKNTPPDFTTNPPSLRNSVFCQKAPKNAQLNGLVQAQDPANDPSLFFDPALKATVQKGSQANTAPFGGAAAPQPPVVDTPSVTSTAPDKAGTAILIENPAPVDCATAITVTVTGTAAVPIGTGAVTVTAGTPSVTAAPSTNTPGPVPVPAGADFGSCTVPQIEFGVGFDNRKETSFQPTDKQSFNHGSAQNVAIITQFICDTLTNTCKANQAAKDICTTAQQAAAAAAAGTGAQADAFNAAFGIATDFVAVLPVDNQGRTSSAANIGPATLVATRPAQATPSATAPSIVGSSGFGNFGSCSVPQIEFGAGFDGRKETSFQPADKASFSQGSAQNIDIITRAICDSLTNTCGADQTAKDTCAQGQAAASAAPTNTGAQADAFNAAFGIRTQNFASVTPLDNQGRPVGAASSPAPAPAPAPTPTPAPQQPTADTSSANVQSFSGSLGGIAAPGVTSLGNGQFEVQGNSAFNNQKDALTRSCDVQSNQCANAANASGNKNGFTVAACNAQRTQCKAAAT